MSSQVIGIAKLKYDTDGDLQIGIFKPKIEIVKEQIKNSEIGKCGDKTIDEIKDYAELLLAGFFSKMSDIELRDMETTRLETKVVSSEKYPDGKWKEIEFEFVYTD